MTEESAILIDAKEAFCSILGVKGRSFGSKSLPYQGICDGNAGVQWNLWKNREGEFWLGVNLEGMKYDNWPIADFILNELRNAYLISLAHEIDYSPSIWVGLHREAWQVTSRPPIEQGNIGDGEVRLSKLSERIWKEMLREALDCLDENKGYRGRAKQEVTLVRRGSRIMDVTPHLNIHTQLDKITSNFKSNVKSSIKRTMDLLLPFYNFVNESV